MNNPLVNQAAMVLPVFLLSACLGGGGGSFDLDSVDTEAPRPAPKYQDVSSEKPQAQKDQGGYGFAMRLKRRNWYPQAKEDEVKLNESDWETTGLPTEPKKLPLKQESVISKVEANNGDNNIYTSPYLTQSNHQNGNTGNGTNLPKNEVTDYKDFKYVYSGWFYKHAKNEIIKENSSIKGAKNGDDGYIFYHGKEPSRQLPASGTVTYKGVWHFATDVKKSQNFRDIIQPSKKQGDRYSGFSGDDDEQYSNKNESMLKDGQEGYGFTSNLEVDFDNKKLTGKLIRNDKVTNATTSDKHTTQYYSLEAQVTGNRFNGKATATDKPGNGETKQHPFVSDSSSLSGGFFGPKGEELGFRFLSDDKKVAVVGSAKTQDKAANGNTAAASVGTGAAASGSAAAMPSENGKLTTVLDAVELTHGGKAIKNLDNFSNAAQLVVDGIMIPLLPKDSESRNNQANQGTNGGTAFTRKFDHTPQSDEKDAQAGTAANGDQAASNTAGDTNGKTKTYEVEVCCSNLNYLKYGLLTRKTAGNTGEGGNGSPTAAQTAQGAQSMFLQGERTDEKEIPSEQNIVYRGSWYGHIANGTSWSGNASNATSGNKADFTVNFGEKKINGTLTAENRQAATFTIEGTIQGNGFSGTAKTADSGFDLDQSNTTGTPKAYITDAKVQGGFYGPKAEELGGWFAYPGDKQAQPPASGSGASAANSATVVFGAKRQQPVR
ncbi:transferrin-binding protein-like solute binding protein [Neisseria meningitidis]|uniref:transferrin-binding protein-like solute binding protein n=1 Tax=Neisseria meningitidis TaxID=487 RepID=UPI000E567703|nr:transferrin-binding protein-like solute binding protein [Neisseria meningitidis]MBH2011580.1 transferrin-binding protein-like solute binding protein [Neisseria meningitidis]MBH2013444.1 transferrin-binding protein-like solute binding protein [Neisseria meningitidis]MBH2021247.1 transferrin-binding protein-like solute binding protein [Neisseria meningitidis]MBH2025640.1 transferrin-binding protein-like solute binding protein [Neisseria meningitidis]MBH2027614.1 transferrin-binding protein-li